MKGFSKENGPQKYHWKGETAEQLTNTYCPLLYLNPWGLDIWMARTFPG